ncbi:UPP2 phosphorylase, partial [Scytalopus superciliaris]|nr:UPP2 phosphorylase [Scytalopus superciliaris]
SGFVHVKNPYLDLTEEDILYHLDLGTKMHNLPAMFGDIKVKSRCRSETAVPPLHRPSSPVSHSSAGPCQGPTAASAPTGTGSGCSTKGLSDPGQPGQGGCLSLLHGMGIPSISIMLHELIKLLHHAKCQDVTIIRIGTLGGLGIEAGSVVIRDMDSSFQPRLEQVVLDDVVVQSTDLGKDLAEELLACSREMADFPTLIGHTTYTYDFYEGEIRGALYSFSSQKKLESLRRAYDAGVRNTEMESTAFAALRGLKGES